MKTVNVKSIYEEIKKNRPRIERIVKYIKQGEVSGFTPPSTLVGEANYPNVSLGVLFTDDSGAQAYDSPRYWVEKKYDVKSIFLAKTLLINARERVGVNNPKADFVQRMALATMSESEVPVELQVSRVSTPSLNINEFYPHAIGAQIERIKVSDNVRIDKRIEKIYYDTDLKATEGIQYLYSDKVDENKISRILSVGGIGIKRRLVPTKWSITAVDDTVGKKLIGDIKALPYGEDYRIVSGELLGNRYTFIFIKGCWSFELLEAWNRDPGEVMFGEGDYELFQGRKEYVKNTAGAYYAIRLAVLEKLKEIGSQFSVVCVREITPEYFAPLGVWVVREGARQALKNELRSFQDLGSAMSSAKSSMLFPQGIERRSKLVKLQTTQARLV